MPTDGEDNRQTSAARTRGESFQNSVRRATISQELFFATGRISNPPDVPIDPWILHRSSGLLFQICVTPPVGFNDPLSLQREKHPWGSEPPPDADVGSGVCVCFLSLLQAAENSRETRSTPSLRDAGAAPIRVTGRRGSRDNGVCVIALTLLPAVCVARRAGDGWCSRRRPPFFFLRPRGG